MRNECFGQSVLQTDTHAVANAYTWIAYFQYVSLKSLTNVLRLYQQPQISSVFTLARQVGIGFIAARAKGQSCCMSTMPSLQWRSICLIYSKCVFLSCFFASLHIPCIVLQDWLPHQRKENKEEITSHYITWSAVSYACGCVYLPLSNLGEEMQAFSPVWRTCSSTQSQKVKRRFPLINFSQ